jgi:flagellar biosynthesis protein FlhG
MARLEVPSAGDGGREGDDDDRDDDRRASGTGADDPDAAGARDGAEGGPRVRRLIAVGGGRGGVGKSLMATNLAVYFAQLGKQVVLVDADPSGANLHTHFGLGAARREANVEGDGSGALERALVQTSVPGLALLPAAHEAIDTAPLLRAGRKVRWLARLRALPAEYMVVDVGPGHGHFALDVMLAADLAICVTVPEPGAIETTYRVLRSAYRRRLRRSIARDRFRLGMLDRATREIGALPSPLELVRALAKIDRNLADLAWAEATRMRMHLVVNQTRVRTDLELGQWMSALSWRHYGLKLDELGHIEHDDTVWLTVRRNKPLLVDSPTCKAARNLERIARRVLALGTVRNERASIPPTIALDQPTLYAALGITRSSNDEEVRRAYKRQREIYATGGLATASLLDETRLAAEQARLDEAYDTLLDPVRRRAYDLSTFADHEAPAAAATRAVPPALAAEQLMLQNELAREIGPDTDFTGALLRKVRESQGIELAEISARSKIGKAHLHAIEEEDYAALPSIVYVRGFVAELAKFLRLDPAQVQKTFLRRMREAVARGKGAE